MNVLTDNADKKEIKLEHATSLGSKSRLYNLPYSSPMPIIFFVPRFWNTQCVRKNVTEQFKDLIILLITNKLKGNIRA